VLLPGNLRRQARAQFSIAIVWQRSNCSKRFDSNFSH
jgi:hypothetical protein